MKKITYASHIAMLSIALTTATIQKSYAYNEQITHKQWEYKETIENILKEIAICNNAETKEKHIQIELSPEEEKENCLLGYLWDPNIYVAINDKPYWEFNWNKEYNAYILKQHKDWTKPLTIEKQQIYDIVLFDKEKRNIHKKELWKALTKNEIKDLFNTYTKKEQKIETIKHNVLEYVLEKIFDNNIKIQEKEFLYYIDKQLQRGFLVYYNSGNLELIWYDKVSTWNPDFDSDVRYFETPHLIINRKDQDMYKGDWVSFWTDSQWYWDKWSRVFNLWKYYIDRSWNSYAIEDMDKNLSWYITKNWERIKVIANFHLAMHKTNPWSTTKLWEKRSQWCIRSTPFTIDLLNSQKLLNGKKGKFIIIWDYQEE
jgi:hypothetical protein